MVEVWKELGLAIPTYRRGTQLESTLRWARSQTVLPGRIIVLDNDPESSAADVVEQVRGELHPIQVKYVEMGRNAGPAGSYALATRLLQAEQCDWMLCSDDDNEDGTTDRLEHYRRFVAEVAHLSPAAVGISGARWDARRSTVVRLADHDLVTGVTSSDCIPGPGLPLYDLRQLAKLKVSFRENLFFGFEELAIGLDIRHHGGLILVDGTAALERRRALGMVGPDAGRRMHRRSTPWRSYFRHRNRILLAKLYGSPLGTYRLALRSLVRALADSMRGRPVEGLAAAHGGFDGLSGRDRWALRYIP